jgi:hypothetical protein
MENPPGVTVPWFHMDGRLASESPEELIENGVVSKPCLVKT